MAWFRTRAGAALGLSFVIALMTACGGSKPEAKTAGSGGEGAADGKSGPAEVGKPAPDLTIQTLNGKGEIKLDALTGSIVVVDFWATWCGPCKQSFPKLEEIAKQNAGKVQVIGVSVDDKQDGVADFAKSNGATFPIGWDDGHTIANRWKVDSMPTTYIVDATGTVRFIHAGYHDGEADAIAKELASLSAGSSSSTKSDVATTGGAGSDTAMTALPTAATSSASEPPVKEAASEPPAPVAKPATKKGAGKGGKAGKPAGKKPKKK